MRPWGYIHQNTYESVRVQQESASIHHLLKLYLIIFATQNPKKNMQNCFLNHWILITVTPHKMSPQNKPSWFWGPVVSIGRPWTRLLGQPALLFLTSVHGPWDSWSVSCCEIPLWICLRLIDIMPKQWWTNVSMCSIPINIQNIGE